jgi:transposase-like protein
MAARKVTPGRIDWDLLENEYVYGIEEPDGSLWFPNYEQLAKRHGCDKTTVWRKWRTSKETDGSSWDERRKFVSDELYNSQASANRALRNKRLGAFDAKAYKVAQRMLAAIDASLAQMEQEKDYSGLPKLIPAFKALTETNGH